VLRCRSPFRSLPSRLMHRMLTQMRHRTVAVHRRWYPTCMGVDQPCCRKPNGSLRSLSLTGTISLSIPSHFARIQSNRSQYFTSSKFMWFLSQVFTEGLLQKASKLLRPTADWSTAVMSHAAVNSDARSIQISSQKYSYMLLSKHASCYNAIRPNYWSQLQLM